MPPLLGGAGKVTGIASFIARKFGGPEFRPSGWDTRVPAAFMLMPKTTMDKDDTAPAGESYVGATRR